jgi:hypothetical protein
VLIISQILYCKFDVKVAEASVHHQEKLIKNTGRIKNGVVLVAEFRIMWQQHSVSSNRKPHDIVKKLEGKRPPQISAAGRFVANSFLPMVGSGFISVVYMYVVVSLCL